MPFGASVFTAWTNATKAKPLFQGHQKPFLLGYLGVYYLRVPDVREQQASMSRNASLEEAKHVSQLAVAS